MADLTLADFVDWIREVPPDSPILTVVRSNQPFAAVLRKAGRPTPNRAAQLVIMQPGTYLFQKPDPAYLEFLRRQFPSLRPPRRKRAEKGKEWWMNERDYALMRVFFGGAQ